MSDRELLARRFDTERPRLQAIATRLLGSVAEAEDAVQETWLRLERTDPGTVSNFQAWLTTVISRVCLDQLRSPRRRMGRPWQVAPWRDEPVTHDGNPAAEAERVDQINVALLLVLDTLSPAERIAFVLHDVFGRPFDEVATVLDRSPAAARQLASRARRRLRTAAPEPTRSRSRRSREIVGAWLAAVQSGDLEALLRLLDDGAVLRADYGAKTATLEGAEAIAKNATLFAQVAAHSRPVLADGRPAVAAILNGRVVSIMAFTIINTRITALDVLADTARLDELDIHKALGLT